MKFAHQLEQVVDNTSEEMKEYFLQYKALKKLLKDIPYGNENPEVERAFIRMLQFEISKFNEFFINKEEELVMKEHSLEQRFQEIVGIFDGGGGDSNNAVMGGGELLQPDSPNTLFQQQQQQQHNNNNNNNNGLSSRATTPLSTSTSQSFSQQQQEHPHGVQQNEINLEQESELCVHLANFHGELILMEHWTNINFTALVKILKKHDKLSRVALRSPVLVSVSKQPFYDTEVLSKMVARAQQRVECLVRRISTTAGGEEAKEAILTNLPTTTDLARQTMSARRTIRLSSDEDLLEEFSNADKDSLDTTYGRTLAALTTWNTLKNSESSQNPFGDVPRIKALQRESNHPTAMVTD